MGSSTRIIRAMLLAAAAAALADVRLEERRPERFGLDEPSSQRTREAACSVRPYILPESTRLAGASKARRK